MLPFFRSPASHRLNRRFWSRYCFSKFQAHLTIRWKMKTVDEIDRCAATRYGKIFLGNLLPINGNLFLTLGNCKMRIHSNGFTEANMRHAKILSAFLGVAAILFVALERSPEAKLAKHIKRCDEYVKEEKFKEAAI